MNAATATAVDHLRARRITETSWVYLDDATARWYAVSEASLRALGAALEDDEPDAYSEWCTRYPADQMPAGWSP